MKTLTVRGWQARPHETAKNHYWIYDPIGQFRGLAMTKKVAEEWLDEASDAAYDRLPAVKMEELREEKGKAIGVRGWGTYHKYWHTVFYYGDKEVARIQTKVEKGRVTVLTLAHNHCVIGRDLKWALKEHGLRLLDTH